MSVQPYWNPKTETMPREELERLQLVKLQRVVTWAWERSPFYRRKFEAAGFQPGDLRSLDDLARIPFTTKQEWLDAQEEAPPFGNVLAAEPRRAIRYHSTSGTSGRTPLRVLDSVYDWHWAAELWAYSFWGFGVRPHDVVYIAFGYGPFIGLWGAHYGAERIGALVVAGGGMTTEVRVRHLLDVKATVLCATPTYALRLAQVAEGLGIDLARDSRVDKIIVCGEPGGQLPATKRLLETTWGARVSDCGGMTEIGTNIFFECDRQPGGSHIIEDHLLEEVVNPETGQRLGYGQRGERVCTSFGRQMIPLIRYRSGDLVEKVPGSQCECGRTFDLYRGGIIGRADDMLLIRGTNVFPSAVEAIVREYPEVTEFQIRVTREGMRDEITVLVELAPEAVSSFESLAERLRKDLAEAHEGLRFNVQLAATGSLPRYELKSRRVVDERPKHDPGK